MRDFTADDHPMVSEWWSGHGWDVVPLPLLPKLGMIAEHMGHPVAAGWVYLDNSVPLGWLEWLVTCPKNPPRISAVGLTHLVECLKGIARQIGYPVLLSSCRQESLANLLEKRGFQRTDENVIHLISITRSE